MAFLEWRKFNFFDLKKNIDGGKIAKALLESKVTCTATGDANQNGQVVLGDDSGRIHLVNRSWDVTNFEAYNGKIILAQTLHPSHLVTIGEDETGAHVLKVWNLAKRTKTGAPTCIRQSKLQAQINRVPTAFAVAEGGQLMAIGYDNGIVMLYRGDITRDRAKLKTLTAASASITGLAFRSTSKHSHLFVSSGSGVIVYSLSSRDEAKLVLDNSECNAGFCALQEGPPESHFMVGRNDAVYCYTADGRGPCYAVEGEKLLLQWFRSHLVIISRSPKSNIRGASANDDLQLTVLDIQNKFIVFSANVEDVKYLLVEFGACYIVNSHNEVWHLDEKDLQSKLSLLFKKNLYDVAIRIAKSQHYDSDSLADIFRQYGDHLHSKGDHATAVEQYIKTIGSLEPSYVIRRFLDSRHTDCLTLYLEALHRQGVATGDHTTLLINCFTRLEKPDQLRDFLSAGDRKLDFDVDVAIKVLRTASVKQALSLAKKHKRHDLCLKILIEDLNKPNEALDYIESLDFEDAEIYMKNYGDVLIKNIPGPSTEFLKRLCTDHRPKETPATDGLDGINILNEINRASPEDYIHLFLDNSERLVDFLEHLVKLNCNWSTLVYNTLIEHYLHMWAGPGDSSVKTQTEKRVLEILQDPDSKYDKHQTLVLCHTHKFYPGVLFLYEENKMYQLVLRHYLKQRDFKSVLATCKRLGTVQPSLWLQALWGICRDPQAPTDILPQVLEVIAKEKLQSPLQVLDSLSVPDGPNLSASKQYFIQVLQQEVEKTEQEIELTTKYRTDSARIKKEIESLQEGPIEFRGARCSACHHPLELPSVHFLCQHAYHQHCFQSFSESDKECPACLPQNKQLLEAMRAQANSRTLHESFHSLLERAEDPFSHVADFFSRGVFNKITLVTEQDKNFVVHTNKQDNGNYTKDVSARSVLPQQSLYGPGAEAKLRLNEGTKFGKEHELPPTEGRMRLQESRLRESMYSSSLEANLTPRTYEIPNTGNKSPRHTYASSPSTNKIPINSISMNLNNAANPFENYDETKNPFADEIEQKESTNPFDEDDYDKNLNPFES